ncbi:MAG TPA: hypothetical protein VK501_23030 [Baekduia sp.]|uniref:hypothetical protein n=1 Tax=Baekduia sp. TaxID=2600305 RepID=UPI002B785C5E|nr:hypothetical protein [Baekduia sp.]HMJ36797.1 hypothetical protein [Baekduia sp.]
MGRRSRKRSSSTDAPPPAQEAAPAPPPAAPRTATYKSRREDAPQPPWAPFPLTELVILLSIVMLGLGFVTGGDRRSVLLGGGFVLVTLAAGELSVREHFAGYRSHSSLLAGICAIVAAIPVWLLPVPQALVLAVGVIAFVLALMGFRRAFMRRSGGVGFRA